MATHSSLTSNANLANLVITMYNLHLLIPNNMLQLINALINILDLLFHFGSHVIIIFKSVARILQLAADVTHLVHVLSLVSV